MAPAEPSPVAGWAHGVPAGSRLHRRAVDSRADTSAAVLWVAAVPAATSSNFGLLRRDLPPTARFGAALMSRDREGAVLFTAIQPSFASRSFGLPFTAAEIIPPGAKDDTGG
jgi:hypothetical protein